MRACVVAPGVAFVRVRCLRGTCGVPPADRAAHSLRRPSPHGRDAVLSAHGAPRALCEEQAVWDPFSPDGHGDRDCRVPRHGTAQIPTQFKN